MSDVSLQSVKTEVLSLNSSADFCLYRVCVFTELSVKLVCTPRSRGLAHAIGMLDCLHTLYYTSQPF